MPNKILVVDDEPDLQLVISQSFRSRIKSGELVFDFAENGAVALEKLKADPEIEVVFTDINMPVMNGLTLLSKIQENDLMAKAVVVSAYGDMKNIRTAMNSGAFDFITKPVDLADMSATIAKATQELEIFKQGIEAKGKLVITTQEKDIALLEKAAAQQEALLHLQEKEKLILQQNEMLEKQVAERTIEVLQQKAVIEEKNREILDSIRYAKRLQEAMLPSEQQLNSFASESFILYLPKDIVAGDFYWIGKVDDNMLVAVADCTGHGVAGALMSMLGYSLLNQIVNESGITTPSIILNRLHYAVIAALKSTEHDAHAGMDIAVCRFNMKENILQFAGANRPLWMIRNRQLEVIMPDKFPLGGLQVEKPESFLDHTIQFEKGDLLYLFTDGYADQFGGENGKKLMTKKFKEILMDIPEKSLAAQFIYLKEYFESWRGINEQVDDVLVMGLRI